MIFGVLSDDCGFRIRSVDGGPPNTRTTFLRVTGLPASYPVNCKTLATFDGPCMRMLWLAFGAQVDNFPKLMDI